ncbi:MAG TPA: hypothetical protein VFC47_05900 [Caulobacteraceae bacterium]|nr:hypothetical protein [Caulobacteraceae bacterium]
MPRIRYIGTEEGVIVFGMEFPPGEWAEVSSIADAHVATLDQNPWFEVSLRSAGFQPASLAGKSGLEARAPKKR